MNLNEIRLLIKGATPGPWEATGKIVCAPAGDAEMGNWSVAREVFWPTNAAYIAAFNPAVMLVLSEVVEAAERVRRSAVWRMAGITPAMEIDRDILRGALAKLETISLATS